jgi:hypothetical protein
MIALIRHPYTTARAKGFVNFFSMTLLIMGRSDAARASERRNNTTEILNCHIRINAIRVVAMTRMYQRIRLI